MELSQFNILIAEDNQINSLILENILCNQGYRVFVADSGENALKVLQSEHIDLVLLDVIMGGISGFQLVEALNASNEFQSIPIIFITSLDGTEEVIKGFDLGGVDYITKPFVPEILIRRVRQQINVIHQRNVISQQKKALEDALASRDQIYAIMSHDLRTPVASLKMIMNILSLQDQEQHAQDDIRQMVYSGNDIAEQLFSLLDNLLKWTKSRLGMMSLVPQIVEFDQTISGIIEVLKPTAILKDITFDLSLEPNVFIYFDSDILNSIVRNLLINSLKFSHPGASVKVVLYSQRNIAVMEVIDTGIGMDEDLQKKIRNSVPSKSRVGTANEQGSGLGLWIVKHFVQGKQGEFFFESEENKGSKFGLKIPKIDSIEH